MKPSIPQAGHDLVRGTKIDPRWYEFLRLVTQAGVTTAQVDEQVETAIAAMPAAELQLRSLGGITVQGNAKDGYFVNLSANLAQLLDVDSAIPANGNVLTWDAVNDWWEPAAPSGGEPLDFLATFLTDESGNYLVDESGNFLIEKPGDTDALPEGTTNLYYTDARADARVALAGGTSFPAVMARISLGF